MYILYFEMQSDSRFKEKKETHHKTINYLHNHVPVIKATAAQTLPAISKPVERADSGST